MELIAPAMSSRSVTAKNRIRLTAVAILVIVIHAIFLCWLAGAQKPSKTPPRQQRLIVQTVALPQPQAMAIRSAPAVEKPAAQSSSDDKTETAIAKVDAKKPSPLQPKPTLKAEAVAAKKTTPPKPAAQKVVKAQATANAKPQAKADPVKERAAEAAAAKKKALLAEAAKSIGKIASSPATMKVDKMQPPTLAQPPATVIALQSDGFSGKGAFASSGEINYDQELLSRLKQLLRLPQYGDVEVELTLLRSGKVALLKIIKAENLTNKAHVEKVMPTLSLPPFGNCFAGEQQHLFKITLSNEPHSR